MIRVLSLFSGCGGMDLGFEGNFFVHRNSVNTKIHPEWILEERADNWVLLKKNQFEIIFANDILREAYAAWKPFFEKRGKNGIFKIESIVDLVKKAEKGEFTFPKADIVIGGFPCQDFSVAGKRMGFNSHKSHSGENSDEGSPSFENRGQLYMWMRKVIELVNPKMFIAENVKGLISLGEVKSIIENDFRDIREGFIVPKARVLMAADYGVPQSRERVFFVGLNKQFLKKKVLKEMESGIISENLDPYPIRTHTKDSSLVENGLLPFVNLRDIFKDLEEPEFSNDLAQKNFSKAKWYGKHVQGQTEINLDSIGPTIRAEHHGNIEFRRLHTKRNGRYRDEIANGLIERRLTVRECARIQTFPDDYEFVRDDSQLGKFFRLSPSSAYKVIGNAVPPLLAFHIANRIENIWKEYFS